MKKKNLYNKAAVVSLVAVMTAGSANAAFAGQWQQDAKGWKFQTGANTFHTNGWQWLDGNGDGIAECYYFGNDGYMIANGKTPDGYTVNTDGAWTENNTVKTQDNRITVPNGTWLRGTGANANKWWFKYTDGSYPANKWVWLDGNNDGIAECYYFDANGWCVANGTTPDGFSVNADGAWVTGSVAVRKPAKHAATGGPSGGSGTTVSKGSSGGGGGSSSGGGSGSSSSGSSGSSSSSSGSSSGSSSSGNNSSNSYASCHDENYGNLGQMSSSQWAETKAAILKFKEENLTDDMTDFEKEMKIIQWLCENCTYNKAARKDDWTYATAYSCIIKGEAQCDGYADAFLQTARLCGLSVKYTEAPNHAYNAIKLAGKWYWVDVTQADTGSTPSCNGISYTYINLNNEKNEKRLLGSGHTLVLDCTGTKYGPNAVYNYLKYGFTPDNKQNFIDAANTELETMMSTYKTDGKLLVEYTDMDTTVNAIYNYLVSRINTKADNYSVCVQFTNADDAEKAYSRSEALSSNVSAKILNKYGATVDIGKMKFYYTDHGLGESEIAYVDGAISYKNAVNYTVNYIYNGETIRTKAVTAQKNEYKKHSIPTGYEYVSSSCEGNGFADKNGYGASADGAVINVIVKKTGETTDQTDSGTTEETVKPDAVTTQTYKVTFICNGEEVGTAKTGKYTVGKPENVYYDVPTGYTFESGKVTTGNGEVLSSGMCQISKENTAAVEFTITVNKKTEQDEEVAKTYSYTVEYYDKTNKTQLKSYSYTATANAGETVTIPKYPSDEIKEKYTAVNISTGKGDGDNVVVIMNANKNITIFLAEKTSINEASIVTNPDTTDASDTNENNTSEKSEN